MIVFTKRKYKNDLDSRVRFYKRYFHECLLHITEACAITKKLYIRLVYLNPWIFISNKNNNIKTFLLIFLLFCILYIFFHVVGHTTTVFCPQPFQKNSPYYRRDLCLGQMSNLHYLLIKVTWEIL